VPNYFGPQRFGVRGDNGQIGLAALRGDYDEALALILGRPRDVDRGVVRQARELFDRKDLEGAAALWRRGFPQQYKKFCLVTGRNPDELKGLAQESPLIAELYQPDGTQKAFLQPSADFPVKLDNVVASQRAGEQSPQRWFCTAIDQGTVTLRLEGLGNGVRISPW
jgi:hypothetical protein